MLGPCFDTAGGVSDLGSSVAAAIGPLGLTLRPEQPDDLPTLERLYLSMRWDELTPLTNWSDDQKISFLQQQFGAQRAHYTRAYAEAQFLIVERAGQPVGRVILHGGPSDIRVVDIGFFPENRNQGYGTALLQALFAEGDASQRTVSVHVEIFNPARALYTRLGFKQQGDNGPYLLMVRPPGGDQL